MAEPMAPARRRAFLAALGETGNITVACARAKVSRSWVRLHRTGDPQFRDACDAAVAAAREQLATLQAGSTLPKHLRFLAGEALVVARGNRRELIVKRARVKQWTASTECLFLERFAASAACPAQARAVGQARRPS